MTLFTNGHVTIQILWFKSRERKSFRNKIFWKQNFPQYAILVMHLSFPLLAAKLLLKVIFPSQQKLLIPIALSNDFFIFT